ncbi:universal stress protein [Halorhabdus amylolytica]|uniref:universal stress protein n=1 Tax=Halorhabdus amylolytica TaxID=2559573 RepID=UPI0010A9CB25|nr:universal stress protein [Halorhabdus amylolytica]
MVETILIPTDGSEHAQRAAAHALAFAEREGATVHALFVVETEGVETSDVEVPALSSIEILTNEREEWGRKVLAAIAQTAEKRDVPVETSIYHGDPAETIPEVADEIDADLVFVGERGDTHEHREGTVTRALRREDDRVVVA